MAYIFLHLAGREAIRKEKNDIIGYSTTIHSSDWAIPENIHTQPQTASMF